MVGLPGSDDEDDDDYEEGKNDDEPKEHVDFIGDIKAKLKANKLRYAMEQSVGAEIDAKERKVLMNLFNAFRAQHKPKQSNNREYLQGKRFVVMVDRRNFKPNEQTKDSVWFYEPPEDCRDIPTNAVSEWYLNASATCLLPPTNAKDYADFTKEIAKKPKEAEKGQDKKSHAGKQIGSADGLQQRADDVF